MPGPHPEVDAYVASQEEDARKLAQDVRSLIREIAPHATESFKWRRACYAGSTAFCSFQVCKKHISLAFEQGVSLDDPEGLLEGSGKAMRHVKIPLDARGVPPGVGPLIKQAAAI